jgi:hypothetical protein
MARQTVKSETDARQGATGHNVRYVLTAGLLLAIVVGGLLVIWYPA